MLGLNLNWYSELSILHFEAAREQLACSDLTQICWQTPEGSNQQVKFYDLLHS